MGVRKEKKKFWVQNFHICHHESSLKSKLKKNFFFLNFSNMAAINPRWPPKKADLGVCGERQNWSYISVIVILMVSIVLLSNYGDYDRSVFQNYHFSLFYGNFRFFFLKSDLFGFFLHSSPHIFFVFNLIKKRSCHSPDNVIIYLC